MIISTHYRFWNLQGLRNLRINTTSSFRPKSSVIRVQINGFNIFCEDIIVKSVSSTKTIEKGRTSNLILKTD